MQMSTKGKVRRSAAEWRTLCERFTRSGLGVAEFCAREAIAESRFKKWYQRSQGAALPKGQFIELVPAVPGAGRWEVELELPTGARLRLRG